MGVKTVATSYRFILIASLAGAGIWATLVATASAADFHQTDLVSDIPGLAKIMDPSLVNAWGISEGPKTPFWISDNGTGLATLYSVPPIAKVPLTVTIPPSASEPPGSTSAPTGQVFNPTSGFALGPSGSAGKALFLFDSEDGVISGWNGSLGTNAVVEKDFGSAAVYKGLALSTTQNGGTLYATNFRSGFVEAYNNDFSSAGTFTDPSLTAMGYAPFNDKVIGNELYVTFALQDAAKHDDHACPGCGFVDIFNLDGTFDKRLISGGALNSPWGLAVAPMSWGKLAGDLLVGNFGDGAINVYNNGNWVAQLAGPSGSLPAIDGLWGLTFGNGAGGGALNTLYFTAGPDGESHGLFGSIAIPEPSTWTMVIAGFVGLGFLAFRTRKAQAVGAA